MDDAAEKAVMPRPMDQPTVAGDIATGIACVVAAVSGHLVLVPGWVHVPQSVAGTLDSPAVMPLLMFTALGLLGAILLGRGLQARKSRADGSGRSVASWWRAGGMLAICGAYLGAIFLVGLPLASVIGLLAALLYFGERRWVLMALVAIIVPAALWSFFVHFVHISMPPAIFELVWIGDTHAEVAGSVLA